MDAADAHILDADARTELEKARLAQIKGIRPSEKFDVVQFETEYATRQKSYSEAQLDADRMKPDVDKLERQAIEAQQAYDMAKSTPR